MNNVKIDSSSGVWVQPPITQYAFVTEYGIIRARPMGDNYQTSSSADVTTELTTEDRLRESRDDSLMGRFKDFDSMEEFITSLDDPLDEAR
ncbi:MAG: hypothetical protein HZB53_16975 [Chloroflexi bacterium]|nr:hypothetical protein [Chloroflexota bacterium]